LVITLIYVFQEKLVHPPPLAAPIEAGRRARVACSLPLRHSRSGCWAARRGRYTSRAFRASPTPSPTCPTSSAWTLRCARPAPSPLTRRRLAPHSRAPARTASLLRACSARTDVTSTFPLPECPRAPHARPAWRQPRPQRPGSAPARAAPPAGPRADRMSGSPRRTARSCTPGTCTRARCPARRSGAAARRCCSCRRTRATWRCGCPSCGCSRATWTPPCLRSGPRAGRPGLGPCL